MFKAKETAISSVRIGALMRELEYVRSLDAGTVAKKLLVMTLEPGRRGLLCDNECFSYRPLGGLGLVLRSLMAKTISSMSDNFDWNDSDGVCIATRDA